MATYLVAREGVTVDEVVWLVLGRQDGRLVERTLALTPGLASLGPVLPVGTLVVVAEPSLPGAAAPVRTVRLWG